MNTDPDNTAPNVHPESEPVEDADNVSTVAATGTAELQYVLDTLSLSPNERAIVGTLASAAMHTIAETVERLSRTTPLRVNIYTLVRATVLVLYRATIAMCDHADLLQRQKELNIAPSINPKEQGDRNES